MPPLLILHLVILAWAFTAVLGKLISLPALDMVVWRTALAALSFLVLSGVLRSPLRLPYAAFVRVTRLLSVFTINVVYNLEPLYGIALATLIFGAAERMTPGFYAGAATIVASVIMIPWLQTRVRR